MNLDLLKSEYEKLQNSNNNEFILLYSIFEEQIVFISKICKESKGQTLIISPHISKIETIYKILQKYITKDEIEIANKSSFKNESLNKNKRINSDKIKVIIGTKTSLFSPFYNLKNIIVIDEEEKDHKQYDSNPRYNVKDICFYLSNKNNIKLILTSKSPSIETYHKQLGILDLRQKNKFTTVNLIDQKTERRSKNELYISLKLQEKIEQALENNTKIIIVNNDLKTEFKSNEKIKNEITEFCTGALQCAPTIITIDSKSQTNISEIEKHQIIIGTEFLVKNYLHKIKNIETLAIFSIDSFIDIPNFKSNEKLFSYITNFINLSNEKQIENLLIQTKHVNNEVINQAIDQKYEDFHKKEIDMREVLEYPPFCTIVRLIIKEENEKILEILNQNNIEILGEKTIETELKTKVKKEKNIIIKTNNKEVLKQLSEYCLLDINPEF